MDPDADRGVASCIRGAWPGIPAISMVTKMAPDSDRGVASCIRGVWPGIPAISTIGSVHEWSTPFSISAINELKSKGKNIKVNNIGYTEYEDLNN